MTETPRLQLLLHLTLFTSLQVIFFPLFCFVAAGVCAPRQSQQHCCHSAPSLPPIRQDNSRRSLPIGLSKHPELQRQLHQPQKAPWVIKVLITLHIFMDTIKNKTAIKKIADCRAKKARRTQFPPEAPDGHTDKQIAFHYQFLECVKNGWCCQYVARDES